MNYAGLFFQKLTGLVLDMAPWLLFGFLIAGVLHVFFPEGKINRLLGRSTMKSVLRAALIGIPLPLCSCGVIPTGISIYKNGASKGAAVSFLISTPQTGADSVMVTYSLLGLPFALIRPVVALLTGLSGGYITNRIMPETGTGSVMQENTSRSEQKSRFVQIFSYAFVEILEDIARWLVIGLLIAAAIAVFVPDDFFAGYIHSDLMGMLIILVASIPLYICATSSVPIAAVLLMKGISPGAALVFLMAGPATNAATISVIGSSMGKKTLITYLVTLIAGSLLFGTITDHFLPREWFAQTALLSGQGSPQEIVPYWLQVFSAILMTALLINIFIRQIRRRIRLKTAPATAADSGKNEIRVFVRGMDCNHCKMTVESNLSRLKGIERIDADFETETVVITGQDIDLEKVKNTVESIGYKYGGLA